MESFHQQVFIRKLHLLEHMPERKVMYLVWCKNKKHSEALTPPPRVAYSNSKLISIPLSPVHCSISTQTCHEQSQSKKQSRYGFPWLYYDLNTVGLVCRASCLS